MSNAVEPWPCPVCAALIPVGLHDCPHCHMPAEWLDLICALDFTIRRFHLRTLEGGLWKPQYQNLVAACRQRRDEMTQAGKSRRPVRPDTGLPSRSVCLHCGTRCPPNARYCVQCRLPLDTPTARMIRYQTFLCREIERHAQAGRMNADQCKQFLSDTNAALDELRARLEQERKTPVDANAPRK